ncbi:MFS transporter [Burkholderia sp. Ac-20379]|uniref:MFS transporter n=1 Tax=Burkholderia sp. Ac-20379 TaxID=2703900 RepID=UPI00198120C3|nr:MFS transporter [Burkholderia sp. Ac-20379]MBN3726011.1 MFS transporter [Burkholderia sp. Ac-20379]
MTHPIEPAATPASHASSASHASPALLAAAGPHPAAPRAARYSTARKLFLVGMLLLSWMLANADRIAMSISIVPITQDFHLDARSAGLLLSAFYVSYALMQLAAGWLGDRFGSRIVLVFAVACWSVFTGLTGVATGFAMLFAIRVLFGIGEGGFVPASTVTIAEAFPHEERARAKSIVIGASFIGSALGSSAIAALIGSHGWRFAYHVFGAIGIAVAVVLWLAIKPAPRRARQPGQPTFRALFASPMLRKTMLIFFFSNIVYVALISWMPAFLIKTRHIDILHAGLATSGSYLIAFLSLSGVGWMLDRIGRGRERLFMVVGGSAVAIFLAAMALADALPTLLVLWTLCLVGYTMVYGTVFAIPLKHMRDELVGSAAGVINFGGQVAAAIAPAAIGMLVDLTPGHYLLAYCTLLAAALGAVAVALTWRAEAGPAA